MAPGPADEARIAAFHDTRWENRLAIVQSMEDERLRWFGLRLIYFEARSVLPEPVRLEVERYLTDQMTGDGSGCLTFDQAMAETERVLGEAAGPGDLLIHYAIICVIGAHGWRPIEREWSLDRALLEGLTFAHLKCAIVIDNVIDLHDVRASEMRESP